MPIRVALATLFIVYNDLSPKKYNTRMFHKKPRVFRSEVN